MTVSSCPSCHEAVTVPPGAAGSARVRCPLCSEEFLLSLVLEKLPPALVLLDAAPSANGLYGQGEISLAPAVESNVSRQTPAFEFEEAAAPKGQRAAVSVSPTPRPKRKQRSAVVELIKIVAAGVAAFPLAILILWWVFSNDILELAPKVPAYASWIVPPKLRAKAKDPALPERDTSGGDSRASPANGKVGGFMMSPGNDPGSQSPSGVGLGGTPATRDPLDVDPTPVPEVKKPEGDSPNTGTLPIDEPKPKPTKPPEPQPLIPPAVDPAKPSRFDLAKNLPLVTPLDLSSAIGEAQRATATVEPALPGAARPLPADERRKRLQAYYKSFARLGEVVISVDPNDVEIQKQGPALGALMQDVAQNPEKQQVLAIVAEQWVKLAAPERPRGLCVLGIVKRISPSGRLYEVEVELATKNKTAVTVLSGNDPSGFYKIGAKVLLLGAVIGDPQNNLDGYEGNALEARCVHFYVPLPADQVGSDAPAEAPAKPAAAPAGPGDEEAK